MAINYIALAVPGFFALIAVELLVARRRGLAVYRLNDAITDLSCGIGSQVVGLFLKALLVGGYAYVFDHFALVRWPLGSWIPWAIAFVGVDVMYYWWHRLSHEVAFMWAVHVVHHQSEDYNLAVALRQAWFSGASSWIFYLPLALIGVPTLVFVAMVSFSTLYQFWIHTRTIGKLGPLEWVLNTASHHRVHHGRNPAYLDKNYAAVLIVWDRVFGTFEEEREEPYYGVIAPYESWNPVWANFELWSGLARKARMAARWTDKVGVFLRGPGWSPPGAPPHPQVNFESEPAVRFVAATSPRLSRYVVVQFVPLVAATVALMISRISVVAFVVAILVVASTVAWGALFERRSWGLTLEVVRLVGAATVAVGAFAVGSLGVSMLVAVVAWSALSVIWVASIRSCVAPATVEALVA